MSRKKDVIKKSYFPSVCRVVLSSTLGLFLFLAPLTVNAYEFLVGTEKAGTFSHFTGRMLCRNISHQLPDARCSTQVAEDEVDNLTNLQSGSIDLAIINSNVLDGAINKSGVFQFLDINYENLTILTPLYDRPIGIIVRADAGIATLNDLKGKRVNGGAPGSIERQSMGLIMKAKGWSVDDFALFEELPASNSQDTLAFCQGTVQAMLNIGVHPTLSIHKLLKNCKAQLLDIDDDAIDKFVASHPSYWKTEINSESYPGPESRVQTFGTRAILVASSAIDQETAYAILKAIYDNQKRLQGNHPALSLYPIQEARKGIEGLQLHKGADQFFATQ
ncbi:MAG: TAXI family TRAP transporter solute-binding subunit [Desulfuromonadales bacterium]|nr:TAXI family TRAP transporter solute-binding subunit [Desulfuromonadales bacterium]